MFVHRQADLAACVASVQMESGKLITIIKGLKAKQFRVIEYYRLLWDIGWGFFLLIHPVFQKIWTFYKLFKHLASCLVFSYCGLI